MLNHTSKTVIFAFALNASAVKLNSMKPVRIFEGKDLLSKIDIEDPLASSESLEMYHIIGDTHSEVSNLAFINSDEILDSLVEGGAEEAVEYLQNNSGIPSEDFAEVYWD